ncbi:glycosyltransferase family 2 protein [Deinococcus sp. Leaf326]|uniref:glycosyltransferase family 2 protein n=1 Tax=Deinococcus sp. Leaf326 TaxID=1736338 RepID=UPI0009EA64A4|nr:glycosyltransferase family 2 protein [Deinococcus sp. Leaf326]
MYKSSVIIVNWNGENHLRECIDSVLLQTYKDGYEIIVVDNFSRDNSIEILNSYKDKIKIIYLKENTGFDKGNNIGMLEAVGEFIVLLNNDTKVEENWLEELIKVAESDEKIGIVGSVMLRWNTRIVDTAGDGCTWAGVGFKLFSGKKYDDIPENIEAFGACAGAALYKRSLIKEIGFLDESFFMNLEDVDLSYRARLAGYDVAIARRSIVYHKVSSSVKKVSYLGNYYASRNIELVWWKNTPRRYLIRSLPDRLLHLVSSFISSLRSREKFLSYSSGKMAAWKEIIGGKTNRKNVQKVYNGRDLVLSSEIYRLFRSSRT